MTSLRRIHKVEGMISEDAGIELADLASQVPSDQAIVEIGVYKGKSACYLAYGAQRGNKARVWAFDSWDLREPAVLQGESPNAAKWGKSFISPATRRAAKLNVHRMTGKGDVALIRSFSINAAQTWNGPGIGLLHLDGDRGSVQGDFHSWLPHLSSNAVVVFSGYREVVSEIEDLAQEALITWPEVRHEVAIARLETTRSPDAASASADLEPEEVLSGYIEVLDDEPEVYGTPSDGLETMTVRDLRDHADTIGLVLPKGNKTKAEIIDRIRAYTADQED